MATEAKTAPKTPLEFDRKKLIEKAGKMINVIYQGLNDQQCFGIGWFFAMDEDTVRLKVTSTRNETYEAMEIDIERIISVSEYHNN